MVGTTTATVSNLDSNVGLELGLQSDEHLFEHLDEHHDDDHREREPDHEDEHEADHQDAREADADTEEVDLGDPERELHKEEQDQPEEPHHNLNGHNAAERGDSLPGLHKGVSTEVQDHDAYTPRGLQRNVRRTRLPQTSMVRPSPRQRRRRSTG